MKCKCLLAAEILSSRFLRQVAKPSTSLHLARKVWFKEADNGIMKIMWLQFAHTGSCSCH